MAYPPKHLVHVGGRWYPKGKEPKTEDTKTPKQDESKSKTPAKPKPTETVKIVEPTKTIESDKLIT
jgi:hypothetical protein